MKKRIFSGFMAVVSAAMFGVLYPEYILLPDTYQYIIVEENCQKDWKDKQEETVRDEQIEQMLFADPDQIVVSSRFLQFLQDEGIILWKDKSSE